MHDKGIDPDVAAEYALQMKTILAAPEVSPLPDLTGWAGADEPEPWPTGPRPRHRLALTDDAGGRHLATEKEIEPLLAENGALAELSDFGAKLSGLIARTSALLHAMHQPDDWWQTPIDVDRMKHAIRIGRYAYGQVLALWSDGAQERNDTALAEYVLERARKLGANGAAWIVTWRALSRAIVHGNGRGRIRSTGDLRRVVDLLVERDELVPDRTSTRAEQWVVRPSDSAASDDCRHERRHAGDADATT